MSAVKHQVSDVGILPGCVPQKSILPYLDELFDRRAIGHPQARINSDGDDEKVANNGGQCEAAHPRPQ